MDIEQLVNIVGAGYACMLIFCIVFVLWALAKACGKGGNAVTIFISGDDSHD